MPPLTASSGCSQPKKPAAKMGARLPKPSGNLKSNSKSQNHCAEAPFVWTAGHQTPSKTRPREIELSAGISTLARHGTPGKGERIERC